MLCSKSTPPHKGGVINTLVESGYVVYITRYRYTQNILTN